MIKTVYNPVLNKSVRFYDEAHTYNLYDENDKLEKQLISGTTFISSFFPEFPRDIMAERVAKRDDKMTWEVIEEWEKIAKIASDFGTKCHLYAESLILKKQDLPSADNEKEQKYFFAITDYLEKTLNGGWELVEAEKMVFNNNIAGTLDLLFINYKEKLYRISDWKTNKVISKTSYSGNEYGFNPIQNLHNCNYEKYLLQLSLYSRLLNLNEYPIQKQILHITEKEVIVYNPLYDYEPYIKAMEQKYFNVRVR